MAACTFQSGSRTGSCEDLLSRRSRSNSRTRSGKSRSPSPARAHASDDRSAVSATAPGRRGPGFTEDLPLPTHTEFMGRRIFAGKALALGAAAMLIKGAAANAEDDSSAPTRPRRKSASSSELSEAAAQAQAASLEGANDRLRAGALGAALGGSFEAAAESARDIIFTDASASGAANPSDAPAEATSSADTPRFDPLGTMRQSASKLEACLLTSGLRFAMLSAFDQATDSLSGVCADSAAAGLDPSALDHLSASSSALDHVGQLVSQVMAHSSGHDPLHFLSVLAVGTVAGTASRSLVGAPAVGPFSADPRGVTDARRASPQSAFTTFKSKVTTTAAADAAAAACSAAATVAAEAHTTCRLSTTTGANAIQLMIMAGLSTSPALCELPEQERLLLAAAVSGAATAMVWQPLLNSARTHVIDKFKVGGKGTRMAGDVAAIVGIESVCAAMGLQPVVLI